MDARNGVLLFYTRRSNIWENETDELYKMLLYKQINWCKEKEHTILILHKAETLYSKVINKKLPQSIIDRCCDFKLLEEKSKEYIED